MLSFVQERGKNKTYARIYLLMHKKHRTKLDTSEMC